MGQTVNNFPQTGSGPHSKQFQGVGQSPPESWSVSTSSIWPTSEGIKWGDISVLDMEYTVSGHFESTTAC